MDVGLVFSRDFDTSKYVISYVDSDYAGDLDNRRSRTGYLFTLSRCSVSWKAMLQPTAALSMIEAECMALTEAIKEAIWLHGLVGDLELQQDETVVFCDRVQFI